MLHEVTGGLHDLADALRKMHVEVPGHVEHTHTLVLGPGLMNLAWAFLGILVLWGVLRWKR
jgi:hypothetical protein